MKDNYLRGLAFVLSCVLLQPLSAATNFWQDINESYRSRAANGAVSVNVRAKEGRRLIADIGQIESELSAGEGVVISVPLPNGLMANYQFSKSSVMPDELGFRYPQIQMFKAFDVNNPANRGRFDITPQGFHGMFQHNGRWVFIDPEMRHDNGNYITYYGSDATPLVARAQDEVMDAGLLKTDITTDSPFSSRPLVGSTLRTYRLAMSATAEYTAFHGGKPQALAAITTMMNRINEVYERDLSIRFELVANNDDLIYIDYLNDPYENSDDDAEINAIHLPSVIPNQTFDIGHVLNTGGGGLAYLAGVCQNSFKSIGMTGTSTPTGDAFYIDYVAHELGHQLGANHTFNGTSLSCRGSNRVASSAWEPGSGSTIMGYAGICGEEDLQANSAPYFHTGSIQQIVEVTEVAGCGTVSAIQNAIPIADAGADFTVPANLPFKLTGEGSDPDGDSLTYSWEQYDTGSASFGVTSMIDNGSRPLFRSWEPTRSPVRYFPNLIDYAAGELQVGETMPTTSRDLHFRLTVRDGKGGVATDEMTVTVVAGGSPFTLTEPVDDTTLEAGSAAFIRWDVAGTNQAPINCRSVDIFMSGNGDSNFDIVIAQGTANDGEYEFTVSDSVTSDSVIMLRCASSGFFVLSAGGLTDSEDAAGETSDRGGSGGGGVSISLLLMCLLLWLLMTARQRKHRLLVASCLQYLRQLAVQHEKKVSSC